MQKIQARCWKEKKLLSLTHLFVLPSTSQLLSPECYAHDFPCSAQCPKNKWKQDTNKIKRKKQDMLCLAEFIFSLLEWNVLFILDFNVQQSTLQTNLVAKHCQQILSSIFPFFCFLHRRSNQIAWSSVIVFPPQWLPLMPRQPQSGSAFEQMDSVWQSGKFYYALRCCTFVKKSQLLHIILSQYFPIVQLSSRFS